MRTLSLILLGAVLWATAMLFIRMTLPVGLFGGGSATLALFGVTALLAPVLLRLSHAMSGGGEAARLPTAALLCTTGVLLDTLVLLRAPDLYAANPARLVDAAAWRLFGVGALLTSALLQDRAR